MRKHTNQLRGVGGWLLILGIQMMIVVPVMEFSSLPELTEPRYWLKFAWLIFVALSGVLLLCGTRIGLFLTRMVLFMNYAGVLALFAVHGLNLKPAVLGKMLGSALGATVWLFYLYSSKRVANTFSEGEPQESAPPTEVPPEINQDRLYELVAEELKNQDYNIGVMARAVAESNGEERQIRSTYIRLRVAQLARDAALSGQKIRTTGLTCPSEESLNRNPAKNIVPRSCAMYMVVALVTTAALAVIVGVLLNSTASSSGGEDMSSQGSYALNPSASSGEIDKGRHDFEGEEAEYAIRYMLANLELVKPSLPKTCILVYGPKLEPGSPKLAGRLQGQSVQFIESGHVTSRDSDRVIVDSKTGNEIVTLQLAAIASHADGRCEAVVGWAFRNTWERWSIRFRRSGSGFVLDMAELIEGNTPRK